MQGSKVKINLNLDQTFVESSKDFNIAPQKKYQVDTEVTGLKGEPYCAYFGIIIKNKNHKPLRRLKWLTDFSGNKKNYSIVFQVPPEYDHLRVIYRINKETPIKSKCQFVLKSPNQIKPFEVSSTLDESYDQRRKYVIAKVKELSSKQESILEKNIVWIFGSARSGTTWLGRDLLSSGTKFINEPLIGAHLDFRNIRQHDIGYTTNDVVPPGSLDYFFSEHYKNTWKFFARKLILNRFYTQVQDVSRKIIVKEPNGSFGAQKIIECLPTSKIIIVIRDGRDVIDSKVDAVSSGSWMVQDQNLIPVSNETKLPFIKSKAHEWVNLMESLMKTFDSHPKNARFMVRYENLLNNTVEELQKIYNFLGMKKQNVELKKIVERFSFENIPKDQKGKGKFTRSAKSGGWKTNFDKDEQDLMISIMGKTLEEFGYSV